MTIHFHTAMAGIRMRKKLVIIFVAIIFYVNLLFIDNQSYDFSRKTILHYSVHIQCIKSFYTLGKMVLDGRMAFPINPLKIFKNKS